MQAPSRVDAAFRFGDFWRSSRGSQSWADVAVIPRLVRPDPTAGSDVMSSVRQRPLGPAQGPPRQIPCDELLEWDELIPNRKGIPKRVKK